MKHTSSVLASIFAFDRPGALLRTPALSARGRGKEGYENDLRNLASRIDREP
jgi:hypothetical protein